MIDVSIRDENVGCEMLTIGLYVYIRTIADHSLDDND